VQVENVRVAGMKSEAWLVQRGRAKPKRIVADYKMARIVMVAVAHIAILGYHYG